MTNNEAGFANKDQNQVISDERPFIQAIMFSKKKFWILSALFLLLGTVLWICFSGHSVPAYSKYIPGDAPGVVTLNSKRLGADLLFGGGLKTDTGRASDKLFERWKRAVTDNGGLGVQLTSDILVFENSTREKKQLYTGVVLKLEDESKLVRFISMQLPGLLDTTHIHMTTLISNPGYRTLIIVKDEAESPLCIGFNAEVMVILKASFLIRDITFFNKEFNRIFHLPKDSSILANSDFRDSQKKRADISFWVNLRNPAFNRLSPKNTTHSLASNSLMGWLNFNKGDIHLDLQKKSSGSDPIQTLGKKQGNTDFARFLSPEKFMGLLFVHTELPSLIKQIHSSGTGNALDRYLAEWALTPADLSDCFDGNAEFAFNGFAHYQVKYLASEYDENFNRIETTHIRNERIPGFTIRLGMEGPKAMTNLLPKLLANKQLLPWGNGYRLRGDMPVFIHAAGPYLFLSTSEEMPHAQTGSSSLPAGINALLQHHAAGMYLDIKEIERQLYVEFNQKHPARMIGSVFPNLSFSANESTDGITTASFSVKCQDPETNALIQLIKLIQDRNMPN